MTRESEAELLDFCNRQQGGDFDAAVWLSFDAVRREELATTALFLASVDWYGNKAELRETAQALLPGEGLSLSQLIRDTGFDCSRFSNMLRRRLAHAGTTS